MKRERERIRKAGDQIFGMGLELVLQNGHVTLLSNFTLNLIKKERKKERKKKRELYTECGVKV